MNKPSIECELFPPESLVEPRIRFKNKVHHHLTEMGKEIVELAKQSLDRDSMTDAERIFHESAMYYDPKRDAPSVNIKQFAEWAKENA